MYVRRGGRLSMITKADSHNLRLNHHILVRDPGGYVAHDMKAREPPPEGDVPPF